MQIRRFKNLLVIGSLSLIPAPAAAQVRYVDDTATGANNGLTWCDAFVRLQDALALQNFTSLEIRVAQGVYRPDRTAAAPGGSGDRLATFKLILAGRNIRGGYAGCGSANPDARDVSLYQTVLSGDLLGNDGPNFANYGDNSYHVVSHSNGEAYNVVLDGFTIKGGNADGSGPAGTITNQGSAVHIRNDSSKCIWGGPTLRNCTFRDNWAIHHGAVNDHARSTVIENCIFRNNYAGEEGAGLLIHSGSATVIDTTFLDNHCDGQGGAVWMSHDSDASCWGFVARPTFTNCSFTGNSAGGEGGGLFTGKGSPELENCTFTNNSSSIHGGGIYLHNNTSATVTNCELSGNSAVSNGGGLFAGPGVDLTLTQSTLSNNSANRGAGLWAGSFSHPVLDGCTISGNTAANSGGGGYFTGSQPIVTSCLFEGNSSVAAYGGGMSVAAGVVEITDSTFRQNSSPQGGGAYLLVTTIEFEDCTFLENQATNGQGGGGIYSTGYLSTSTQLSLRRCTFRENHAGEGGGLYSFSRSTPTLTDCSFIDNTATIAGGGFQAGSADPALLINCRFIGNSSNFGGGSYLYRSEATFVNCLFNGNTGNTRAGALLSSFNRTTLTNCTLTENSANSAGGISIDVDENDPSAGLVACTNSIIWNNSDQSGMGLSAQILPDPAVLPTVNYSIVQGWDGSLPGANNLGADPLFADSSGPDNTAGTEDDDLHILPASPAKNAGSNAALPPGVIADLDGNVRISDMVVDMGVFEVAGACPNGTCSLIEDRCTCPADCGAPLASEVTCNDGDDEDCDDLTDCQDSDCAAAPNCQPPPVPAASTWSLIILAVLVATAGTILTRRPAGLAAR
jgi:predicted outer membrane repeat protein